MSIPDMENNCGNMFKVNTKYRKSKKKFKCQLQTRKPREVVLL